MVLLSFLSPAFAVVRADPDQSDLADMLLVQPHSSASVRFRARFLFSGKKHGIFI